MKHIAELIEAVDELFSRASLNTELNLYFSGFYSWHSLCNYVSVAIFEARCTRYAVFNVERLH